MARMTMTLPAKELRKLSVNALITWSANELKNGNSRRSTLEQLEAASIPLPIAAAILDEGAQLAADYLRLTEKPN